MTQLYFFVGGFVLAKLVRTMELPHANAILFVAWVLGCATIAAVAAKKSVR